MKLKFIVLLLLCLFFFNAMNGQGDSSLERSVVLNATLEGIATSNNTVPFWMRTNQYGNIPLDGISTSVIGDFYCDYRKINREDKWYDNKWDCGIGINGRLNAGRKLQFQLIESYIKFKFSIFEMKIGRTKDQMGIADTTLSSGAFSLSGNAPGIPKVEIRIPEFWSLPGTKGLIAVKGNFAMGFLGNTTARDVEESINAFYHQKSLYGRIGKPSWRVKIYGGFNHQVMWGGERAILGPKYQLNTLQTMKYVILGKAYGDNGLPISKVGNHIGSVDQAISYQFKKVNVKIYHQFFYDVGGLAHLNNIKDGLTGLSFENTKQANNQSFRWSKILIEFLYSKSQGGELDAKITPSGDEDYYNNYVYYNGWSYMGENLGNNFMTNKKYQRKELPSYSKEYFGNNRIMLFNLGAEWQYAQWSVTNKFSYSKNYGTYATSPIGNTTGTTRFVQPPPYFSEVSQFSAYLEASRPLKNNFSIGFVLAGDYGDLLYNSVGGMIKLTKSW